MVMGHEEINNSAPRRSVSLGRASSASSSLGRQALRFSNVFPHQVDNDTESDSVSEAGDIGDRALPSNRNSWSGSFRLSFGNVVESTAVIPIPDVSFFQSNGNNATALNTAHGLSPSPLEGISTTSADATAQSTDKKRVDGKGDSWILEYISCLAFLALFGILGVITRFYLQKLFGPGGVGATSQNSYMYLDLPSNMVGSFLMGWLGVVFKGDISRASNNLAIGLTTGFLGSLTTFSGWNQKMLDLSIEGRWVFAALCILIGLFLAAYSIIFGIETAEGFKWLGERSNKNLTCHYFTFHPKFNSHKSNLVVTIALLLILCVVWGVCISLVKMEFKNADANTQLWLACIVGPFGVWIRWWLARLNGRGLGEKGILKWVPFGTLAANVLAASIMAALAALKKALKTNTCNTVATGIQIGFLGCLSTVSTFIAEFHAMRQSKYPWRAYAYAMGTILISYALGTLIYSLPVWIRGYE